MRAHEIIDFARGLESTEPRIPSTIDPSQVDVARIVTDQSATTGDLAWISEASVSRSPERVRDFRGSMLICPTAALPLLPNQYIAIATPSPKAAFAQILSRFFSDLSQLAWPAGPTTIAPDAVIGKDVRLAPGVVIGPQVVLGDGVQIGPNSCIANAVIGGNVRIGCNCSIGLPGFGYARDDTGQWIRFPHVGGVRIEADVEIGSNTCIDRGSIGDTLIRQGAKIDNLVHVAHNCDIGAGALLIANSMIGGSTVVGALTWVAPSSSINNKLTIGDSVTIGTGAVVIRDVPAGSIVVGNPAKPLPRKTNE